MNRKLIALDLDGTLLSSTHDISSRTQKMIQSLIDDGHIVTLATGRILSSARAVARTIGLDLNLIGSNGAVVYDTKSGYISRRTFSAEQAHAVIDLLQKHDIYHHFYTIEDIYCNRLENTAKSYHESLAYTEHPHIRKIYVEPNLKLAVDNGHDVYKFGICQDDSYDFDTVRAELENLDGLCTVFSNKKLLDVMLEGINKWQAIAALMKLYTISAADVIAMGDSPNDIDMLTHAGVSVAMGNACPEVKAVAKHVTATNDQDGVYLFLKDYFGKQYDK